MNKLKRIFAAILCLVILAAACGCSAPEDAKDYSYELLREALISAATAGDARLELKFLRQSAPGFDSLQSDIESIHNGDYILARFAEELSWGYESRLMYSLLTVDITYSADTALREELEAGENPGLVPVEFTEEFLEDWLTRTVAGAEPTAVCVFSGDPDDVEKLADSAIDRLNNENYLFCYYVDRVEWQYTVTAGFTELRADMVYKENTVPFDNLVSVKNELDAVTYIMDCWAAGERVATFMVEDPSWDHDTVFTLCEAAEANSGVLSTECTYFNANLYPKTGDVRVAEAWLSYPMMDIEVERRDAALVAKIDSVCAGLSQLDVSDTEASYRILHDTVTDMTDYDDSIADATIANTLTADMYSGRTAYGAFISGSTVCTGYARAFKALCDRFKLPCWVVYGECDGEPHAWNAVLTADGVSYVDCTFDDTDGTLRYFLMPVSAAELDSYTVDEGYILADWVTG